MAESIVSPFTKEFGGIPVWAMGVGAAGIGLAIYYFRGQINTGTVYDPTEDLDSTEEVSDGLPDGPIGDWLRENPGSPSYPIGGKVNGLPAAITNLQWARFAQDELLSTGADPLLVASALYKYLRSQPLTVAEEAIIRKALQLFGATPEGPLPVVPGGSTLPIPPPVTVPIRRLPPRRDVEPGNGPVDNSLPPRRDTGTGSYWDRFNVGFREAYMRDIIDRRPRY